ncbi:response regulator [Pseudomonas sp. MAFF 302046]|uniref:Response regulator n=1 Tax=Pseudomonas morbosilactucae TaxID=2938197 RepID=A0ABT0JLQ0_9PSED|nr:response regulator [Pseudomonas morbosilactucae]MCK9816856.1 response regulator [Pseudomonas morbosilactucae]
MANKALRILIADEQHFYRMRIERTLNQMGYYRIAPVHSLEELLSLVEYGCEPFDLLIVNASLGVPSGLDPLAFCQDHPLVGHALVYDGHALSSPSFNLRSKVQISPARLPDMPALKRLMARVDPPQVRGVTHEVNWMPALHQGWRMLSR